MFELEDFRKKHKLLPVEYEFLLGKTIEVMNECNKEAINMAKEIERGKMIEEAIKNLGEVDIIFVDYLQRLRAKGGKDRYEKISAISSGLKTLATKYDIPVVTIASLNRAYSERANKEPALSDFRDSGNIEYDLDVALLLYRAGQYREDAPIDEAKVIISKNRYGAANISIDLKFEPERSKFYEREEHSIEEKTRKDIYG